MTSQTQFDLRLYALVPSFTPLEIYMYRSGFARFTNSRYSNNPSDIANSFIHLTNVAIQKTSDNYDKKHGGKWDLKSLKLYMMSKHGCERVDKLFYEIQMIIVRSLQWFVYFYHNYNINTTNILLQLH